MYKETHVFKDPRTKKICHYLDIKNPKAYRPATRDEWRLASDDLFKYHSRNPKTWILERFKPLVLENK